MKLLTVEINGIKYIPENTSSTADEPLRVPKVNYRALVNDKLQELETFYEKSKEEVELGNENSLCLACGFHGNDEAFIIAGRVQEVLKDVAFYTGNNKRPLYLSLNTGITWKQVYNSLLNNEIFIQTGVRF